jgi:hypothetical protein
MASSEPLIRTTIGLDRSQPETRRLAADRSAGNTQGWRTLGLFGLLLSVVGLSDVLLVWYPLGFGNAAWEFAVIDQSFSSLPLLSVGLAAMLAAALSIGPQWRVRLVALPIMILGIMLAGAFVLYLLDIPVVLNMTPPEVAVGVKKAIVKTTIMAIAFPGAYLIASFTALRSTSTRR